MAPLSARGATFTHYRILTSKCTIAVKSYKYHNIIKTVGNSFFSPWIALIRKFNVKECIFQVHVIVYVICLNPYFISIFQHIKKPRNLIPTKKTNRFYSTKEAHFSHKSSKHATNVFPRGRYVWFTDSRFLICFISQMIMIGKNACWSSILFLYLSDTLWDNR